MAFSETEKLSTLKQMMKYAVEQGTSWDTFKAEFAAMSGDFKDEVIDFLDVEVDRADTKIDEWEVYKTNAGLLKTELEGL